MAAKLKFYANITNGKLEFLSPDWVREKMRELSDGQYTLEIEKYFGQRTNPQNRYLHGIVIPMVFDGLRAQGFEKIRNTQDAKDLIKSLFLTVTDTNGIETFSYVRHTSDLSTSEMVDFIEEVKQWAAIYLSISIPEAGSQAQIFKI